MKHPTLGHDGNPPTSQPDARPTFEDPVPAPIAKLPWDAPGAVLRRLRCLAPLLLICLWSISAAVAADQDIRFNSLGFLPDMPKRASVAAQCSSFEIRKASDDTAVTQGTATGPTHSYDTDEDIWTVDFSSLTTPGEYYLSVPGVGRTPAFRIGRDVYDVAFYTVMRGFYLWRCGTAVSGWFGSDHFQTQACHLNDASQHFTTGDDAVRDGKQGWHDAGDYGKYVVNAGVTMGLLFKAWEHYQSRIEAVSLDLPSTAAGYPDFLEELKWETDWLLKMQYPDGSGKVSHKLTAQNFSGFIMPQNDSSTRFFTDWSSAATADFVAIMATASRLFRPYDPAYADRCLSAAWTSYHFLVANPANKDPDLSEFHTGEYKTNDSDDRLWATAELWETTGDADVLADFESRYNAFSSGDRRFQVDFDWGSVRNLGFLTYIQSQRSGRDASILAALRGSLTGVADLIVRTASANAYARPLGSSYYWGCNGGVARQTLLLQSAYLVEPKPEYKATALDAIAHLFGRNVYRRSFVTGLGIDPPLHPHDRRSGADGIANPWPGYVVGGAQQNALDWHDVEASYQTNEIAINWQAALVYGLAGFLSGDARPAVFPQVALGGGYRCILLISNKTDASWSGRIRLFQSNQAPWVVTLADGEAAPEQNSEFALELAAASTRKLLLTTDQPLEAGYLSLSGDGNSGPADLAVSFFYNYLINGRLADSVGVPALAERSAFTLPVEYGPSVNTGFAWARNAESSPFNIVLRLWDGNGSLIQTKQVSYAGQEAEFFSEVFDQIPDGFVGRLDIQSDLPLYLTALRLEYVGSQFQLTSTPPQ